MTPPLPTRPPLDPFPYPRHPDSRPFGPDLTPGSYVFVQDAAGIVQVVPETEGHLHPKVLGGGGRRATHRPEWGGRGNQQFLRHVPVRAGDLPVGARCTGSAGRHGSRWRRAPLHLLRFPWTPSPFVP